MRVRDKKIPITVSSINRHLRLVELDAAEKGGSPGTGATILRLRPNPIGRLADKRRITPEALASAQEIEQAFTSITSALWIKPVTMQRVDRGYNSAEPEYITYIQGLYRQWANAWSVAKKQHQCLVLPCTIGMVIDQRSAYDLCQEYHCRHSKVERAAIVGLQDWARRAGKLTKTDAQRWGDISARFEAGLTA